MVAEKPVKALDVIMVEYTRSHWERFGWLRSTAGSLMECLEVNNLPCLLHGSLARGDVSERSDMDMVIPQPVPTSTLETVVSLKGHNIYSRAIVQATPVHAPKAHLYLDPEERICMTVPLVSLRTLEMDFYKFGGTVDLADIRANKRVPGCTKRLTLIEPTTSGHRESMVREREEYVAKVLGVHPEIVRERVRVLSRRDAIGRTGVFLKSFLRPDETFEEHLKRLTDRNPAVRRLIAERS